MNNKLRREFQNKFNSKQNVYPRLPALLGDGFGHVKYEQGFAYVRIAGVINIAMCDTVPYVHDLPVWVGFDIQPAGVLKVMGQRDQGREMFGTTGPHAASHEFLGPGPTGGTDFVKIQLQQFMPLSVWPYSNLSVILYPGVAWINGEYKLIADVTTNPYGKPVPQVIDFTEYSWPSDGKEFFALITITKTGTIEIIEGNEVDIGTLQASDIPEGNVNTAYKIAAVRRYNAQGSININRESRDIVDLRFPMTHTHSDDDLFDKRFANITMAGRLFGGIITSNGDGTVAVTAGGGLSKDESAGPEDVPTAIDDGQGSALTYVEWDAIASLELLNNTYNYIYYDRTDNQIKITSDFYAVDFTQDFTIGRAYRSGNEVLVRLCGTNTWNFNRRVQLFGEEYIPVVRAKGLIISASGTRNIAITAGIMWAELVNRFSIDAFDSSGTDTFTTWYRDGLGGWTSVASQTQIDNINYDNNSGTLQALTANRYGVHWVYVIHDSSVHVVYGQDNYTLAQAQVAIVPSSIPGKLAAYATLVGKITVQKSSDTFTEVLTPFTTQFTTSLIQNHNDLSGLQGGTAGEYYHFTSAKYAYLNALTEDYVEFEEQSSDPATPAAGFVKLFIGTDDKAYLLFDDGSKQEVGSGGGGIVASVVAGDDIDVDSSDPAHPVVSLEDDIDVDSIQFNLSYAGPHAEGLMHWNSDDGIPEIGLPGGNVILQIGQELVLKVKNGSGSTINNGEAVYITGGSGVNVIVDKASSTDFDTALVIGLATEDITNNQYGYVTIFGLVRDIDTSSMSVGDMVWLGETPGTVTNVRPEAPDISVHIGYVVISHATEGVILVKVKVVSRLRELSDVNNTDYELSGSGQFPAWNGDYFDFKHNANYPMVKQSIAVGESLTIPTGYSLVVGGYFQVDGDITVDGTLTIVT